MTYIPSEEFSRAAMLVTLNVRCWQGKREDKRVSRKVAADNGAAADAGAYMKNLVPKGALEPVTKAVSALRTWFSENSMPWLDEGTRVLASAQYQDFRAAYETYKDAFESAVRDFVNAWPAIVADAQRTRGALFNPADYPADIAGRFSVRLAFRPIADTSDFRIAISESERALLKAQIEGDMQAAQSAALGDLYRRLGESVRAMAERLRAYKVDASTGKTSGIFRDSLVENLRELVALIPAMNFAADPVLEEIRALVQAELCGADAQTLRDSDATRAKVAESAESIMARLAGFMPTE